MSISAPALIGATLDVGGWSLVASLKVVPFHSSEADPMNFPCFNVGYNIGRLIKLISKSNEVADR